MTDNVVAADDLQLPVLLYGTAWKEDATQSLVELALTQGFRGIDTANQRRHYHEAAVGQAIAVAIKRGLVKRNDLFLQTKFTFQRGQDHRLPYDPTAPIRTQVDQSFASSLEHLGVDCLDSYLLHGPTQRIGLSPDDWDAWQAMEVIHDSGRVRALGISNVSLEQLRQLCDGARIFPRFVQNRCYAVRGWDHSVRDFCSANGIIYQGFSLLTANQQALARPEMIAIAKHHGKTVPQIVFRFALQVGMLPLTGTTNANHMRADLDVANFHLEPGEVEILGRLADL
jgi:diketogulonate reductase-like aldo/keto reductase